MAAPILPTVAPPAYQDTPTSKTYGSTSPSSPSSPLLGGQAAAGGSRAAPGNAWADQGDDDVEDFKVGVNVADCDLEIRMGFIRRVYVILFIQLLATFLVASLLHTTSAIAWTRANTWSIWPPLIGSFGFLFGTWWKRHEHPANLLLLGGFTVCESLMIGTVTSYYESTVVLQALLITLGVFLGLTLFTFQSKYDFSSLGPLLFAGLMGLMFTGLVQFFLPFSRTTDLVYSGFGVLLFAGYTVYDTHAIMKRLSPDEYIMGALSLYLDFLNLFLYILRILNNTSRD